MRKYVKIALMSAVTTAIPVVAFATQTPAAYAAGCYAGSCYNRSAASEGCAADAKQIYKVPAYNFDGAGDVVGWIQLYYSPTCRAAWGRVTSSVMDDNATVIQSKGETTFCQGIFNGNNGLFGCNTPMVNDAGVTSYTYGTFLVRGEERGIAQTGSY